MNVLFIYPVPPGWIYYYQGIGFLSAVLKQHSHQTRLQIVSSFDKDQISSAIDECRPDLVCISCTTNQFALSTLIAEFIYGKYRLPLVMGGIHSSFMPEESISASGLMAICLGEGEYPLLELAEAMAGENDFTSIRNLWFKAGHPYTYKGAEKKVPGSGIIKNPIRPLIPDLDELPYPDRDISRHQTRSSSRLDFMAGRGCPFDCSYCFNRKYRELFPKGSNYCRTRSVSNLINEISEVAKDYPDIKRINFHDDTFNLRKTWLKDFCAQYASSINIPFECSIEANLVDEESLRRLSAAGCRHVFIGVETGSERQRKEVLSKKVTNRQIMSAFTWAKKYDIATTAHFMLGIPEENESTILESVHLAREIGPSNLSVSIFYPYPGTALYDLCLAKGWISDRKVTSYFGSCVLDLPGISFKEVENYAVLFPDLVRHSFLEGVAKAMGATKTRKLVSLGARIRKQIRKAVLR